MAIDFNNFLNIWEICIFQFNLSLINTPTNLILLLNSIGILLIVIFNLIDKSDLLFHVVKHEIMEKLINKCIPQSYILYKLDSHE